MITGKLRKVGNSYVVTIPPRTIREKGLTAGDYVALEVHRAEVRPALAEDIRRVLDEHWTEDLPALRYLAGE